MKRIIQFLVLLSLIPGANADQRPVLSLVVDDLGYSFERGKTAIELDGDHTYALIPGTAYGNKLAAVAKQNNKEIILHLPLQALDKNSAMESNALNESMDENVLSDNLREMLAEFPGIRGVNNHMGSRLTAIDYFMKPIMEGIKSYDPKLYFLDSRTTANSIAYYEARESGLNSISRDVFLDHEHGNLESLKLQFQIWLQKARDRGAAIAIGHPHRLTIDFLRESLPRLSEDFRFMRISNLIGSVNSNNIHPAPQNTLSKMHMDVISQPE